jgi:hypothetical protein
MAKPAEPEIAPAPARPHRAKASKRGKHIGGYFGADTVERFALLRARLSLDNSQLIERAIADLWSKHSSKRAFGD